MAEVNPFDEVANVFREHAGGELDPETEDVVRALYEMTVQPTLASHDWGHSREWVLKQMGKIARYAGGDNNGNGGSITAQSLMDAANDQIPKMHDACNELLASRDPDHQDYGPFCHFYQAF